MPDRPTPSTPARADSPPGPDPDGGAQPTDPHLDDRERCGWATGPWLTPYHDTEWGVPVIDDRRQFEHLVLEAAQAGLSWLTVLKRRDAYRRAFAGFDPAVVARFGRDEVEALLADPGIIRNRQKVEAAVANAAAFCELREETGGFYAYALERVGGSPIVNAWRSVQEIPASTPISEAMSKDLRRRGFRFVGPVICYSHLQSVGLVMDHVTACFRYSELAGG